MPFFLIMSPFVTFAALSCVTSLTVSLVAAAAVAAALTLADYLRGASIKLLSVGPMLMFTCWPAILFSRARRGVSATFISRWIRVC